MPHNQVPKAYNGISTDFIYAGRTELIGGWGVGGALIKLLVHSTGKTPQLYFSLSCSVGAL